MAEYKPNSHKYKQEVANKQPRVKLEKVIKGSAKTKKETGVSKFLGMFISDESVDIKSYVINDIIVPNVKKAILGSIDMLLNGGSNSRADDRRRYDRVSYNRYYDDRDDRYRRDDRTNKDIRIGYREGDIELDYREDCEEVLRRMDEALEVYPYVTVADLYDLVGETAPYTANKYGWTNLRNADVVRYRRGYTLRLPKPMPLD